MNSELKAKIAELNAEWGDAGDDVPMHLQAIRALMQENDILKNSELFWKNQANLQCEQKHTQAFVLRGALEEIREIWAGAECGAPGNAQEAYAIRLCKQQYQVACRTLAQYDESVGRG